MTWVPTLGLSPCAAVNDMAMWNPFPCRASGTVGPAHLAAFVSFQLTRHTVSAFPFLRVGRCATPSEDGEWFAKHVTAWQTKLTDFWGFHLGKTKQVTLVRVLVEIFDDARSGFHPLSSRVTPVSTSDNVLNIVLSSKELTSIATRCLVVTVD